MQSLAKTVDELQYRIEMDLAAFHGDMPERNALAWHGYLAGVFEWGIIDLRAYRVLRSMLPRIAPPSPIEVIFLGRPDTS